jgi:FkbH-like protein
MTASPEWQVRSLRVRDRFGDNGLVGVAITHCIGEVCEIDTLLLSCRVIGRTVETALLANLAQEARNQGMLSLQGWYLPTKKNVPAKDVYRSHGFKLIKEVDQDTLWEFDLSTGRINCPEWLTCSMA